MTAYATKEQFRERLGASSDAAGGLTDAMINLALSAAASWIDNYCHRTFIVPADDADPTVRTFRAEARDGQRLRVDDIAVPDSVTIQTGTFGGDFTDWGYEVEVLPDRCPPEWPGSWPRTYIDSPLAPWASYGCTSRRVQVSAVWGVPVVPNSVVEANLIQGTRYFKRKDSPEGVAGSNDWGVVRLRDDPDVADLLAGFRIPARILGSV